VEATLAARPVPGRDCRTRRPRLGAVLIGDINIDVRSELLRCDNSKQISGNNIVNGKAVDGYSIECTYQLYFAQLYDTITIRIIDKPCIAGLC
jgi:hypothetical protein